MIDLKAIRAAAEAATPGPWMAAGPSFGEPLPKYINCVVVENEDGDADDVCIAPIGCDAISTNDLTFIATANPATVIALCDEIERLRKEGECLLSLDSAEKLLEEIERLRKDAGRWKQLVEMEASRAVPETLLFYIQNPDKLDRVVEIMSVAKEADK